MSEEQKQMTPAEALNFLEKTTLSFMAYLPRENRRLVLDATDILTKVLAPPNGNGSKRKK